ncbi:hypothetical protein PIB30_063064 [Stylosanthes scabra]|uniref:SHSP domain-containing protein n=1 Tax=Stylosanthes scabra TaxID=79078 RepID=A0ABU6QME0_9FABA|nr:hypothetical protein [Stylosanthes scabra]
MTGLWDKFPTARTVQDMLQIVEKMMEDPFAMSTLKWSSSPLPSEGVEEGKEDVKVWIDEEKMLVVKAEKKAPKKIELGSQQQLNGEEEKGKHHLYGRYSSRIALLENVQFEKIKAEVKDGVLYITIPKATSYSNILDIDVQ